MAKKEEFKNVKVLKEIRIKGEAQPVGRVIAKSNEKAFASPGEWRNLVAMDRLEETNDPVGDGGVEKPKAAAKKPPAKPKATKPTATATMPE